MASETTSRSNKERPRTSARPQRVIRLHALPAYLGVTRSAIDLMVRRGQLHPFSITGRRAKVVAEDEIIQLQERAKARAKAEAVLDDDETEADEPRRHHIAASRAPDREPEPSEQDRPRQRLRGSRTRPRQSSKSDEVQHGED
jgi:predicted DNA-binding transcriptional regulator AlpA